LLGTPVAIVVLLLYTQPLWTTILSKLFLNEKITKYKIFAVFLVLMGVIVLLNPLSLSTTGTTFGVLLALVGGLLLSIWVILGKVAGTKHYHPITTEFGSDFFTVLFLILFFPLISVFVKNPSIMSLSVNIPINVWFYLFIFFIAARLSTHLFYFYGVKKVPVSTAGIILLLEPVSAAILAAVFFNQPLTWNILLGGGLILLSNYIVIKFADTK
jgi:drug/metabolite transporter (DMT)-like permease